MIYKVNNDFKDQDSVILRSYLDGYTGSAYVDDLENPSVVQVIVDYFVFYTGNLNSVEANELIKNLPEHSLVKVPDTH